MRFYYFRSFWVTLECQAQGRHSSPTVPSRDSGINLGAAHRGCPALLDPTCQGCLHGTQQWLKETPELGMPSGSQNKTQVSKTLGQKVLWPQSRASQPSCGS
jgi:hypothetical protein